jgi:hypothetical protein
LLRERAELSCREVFLRRRPVVIDLPQWLGREGGKSEPIVELVFLEVSEGDDQESRQGRSVVVLDDTVPNLRCKNG